MGNKGWFDKNRPLPFSGTPEQTINFICLTLYEIDFEAKKEIWSNYFYSEYFKISIEKSNFRN